MTEIREGLAGNLCRCTGFTRIFESVIAATAENREERIEEPAHAR
jgi:aerobic-type carbon monoxide dehydrogenase small subunit (CoxS/CutS family)